MIRNRIVETKTIRASELVNHPKNWRTHPEKQRAALQGAVDDLGQVQAVTVRRLKSGKLQLVDGHLRKELFGDELITVNVTDLNDREADKALLTLDPLAAMAGKNNEALAKLLASTAFDNADLQKMLEQMGKSANFGHTDPDAVPPKPTKSKIKRGDVFELGGHRLMCGDSTEDIPKLLGGEKPNLMVTDPPYGVEYDPSWRTPFSRKTGKKRLDTVKNDDRADWTDVWKAFSGDVAYVWHGALHSAEVQTSLYMADFEVRAQIIWAKDLAPMSRGAYHWKHEPCWYAVRKASKADWFGDRKQTTLWDDIAGHKAYGGGLKLDDQDTSTGHSTQKPVELFRRPMLNHTREKDSVLEPFCGSGSCIIAGEQTRRRVFAMELDPTYVDQAIKRWELFSGKKAKSVG